MINSMMTIAGHMTDRILCNEKGAALSLPSLYPSLYQFKLELVDRDSDGKPVLVYPHVTALSASIGLVYAVPRAGTFKLRYGSGTATAELDCNESAADFRTKLALLTESATYGLDVVYQPTPSVWMCRFTTPGTVPIPLNGIENELEPETFIRVRQFIQNAETWLEVRLMQGPVASTSAHDTVLPDAPTVREIRPGSIQESELEEIIITQIQAVTVPPDFSGTYILKFDGRQTVALSRDSGTDDIGTALNALYTDGQTRFVVTNPEENNAYVEFVGPFAGMESDLLEVVIGSTGNAELTFNLNLYTTEVAEALQREATADASFEVKLHITDPTVPDDPGQDLILFQAPVTLMRPLHWEGLEEAAPINWLFPPNPKDYIPFTLDQIIVGDLTYSIAFGDGVLSDYVISHHLDSDALSISIRENVSGGRLLEPDEYSVVFDNANALTVHIEAGPPGVGALLISIFASGPVSAFLNHTHTIGQIIGLQALIDEILARLSALEALLPTLIGLLPGGTSPFGTDPAAEILGVQIQDEWDLIPTNRLPVGTFDPSKLAPAGLLLPAVHDVVELGEFTADPATDEITLSLSPAELVDGQRARINTPVFSVVGPCTFDSTIDTVTSAGHGLVDGRRVMFAGGQLPQAISVFETYYVINATTDTFQISPTPGGSALPLLTDGDTTPHTVSTSPDLPGGLSDAVDYFMVSPSTTVFQLAATIGGDPIDITSPGVGLLTISTIEEAPSVGGVLPPPGPLAGNAYSVRENIYLRGERGIPSETVVAGDIIASDGRVWYHVTRSDVPGSNSFYPMPMEKEIFRIAINDRMLAAGSLFTLTFDLILQMFRHDCNIQYLLVVEIGDVPEDVTPSPTGPNLFAVVWNKTPLMQQRIIVTDTLMTHHFGAQVVRLNDGRIKSNKKQYGVEIAGDVVPSSPNFAMRVRLIEFDTEDNIPDAAGLIYYRLEKGVAGITRTTPTTPNTPSATPP